MGIARDKYPEKGQKPIKSGLPVKKAGREYPYLYGQGRAFAGRLSLSYGLLPQYMGRTFLTGKSRSWKREAVERIVEKTWQQAQEKGSRQLILTPELGGSPDQIPPELLAVCLYRFRPFDKLGISLPEDGGEYGMEQALELITPYLPRMRQVALVGGDGPVAEKLERFLYEEFGIIMTKSKRIPSGYLFLDLGGEEQEADRAFFSGNSGRISRGEALKFLDTTVKNGYNT